jgi:hypothetical protein
VPLVVTVRLRMRLHIIGVSVSETKPEISTAA